MTSPMCVEGLSLKVISVNMLIEIAVEYLCQDNLNIHNIGL